MFLISTPLHTQLHTNTSQYSAHRVLTYTAPHANPQYPHTTPYTVTHTPLLSFIHAHSPLDTHSRNTQPYILIHTALYTCSPPLTHTHPTTHRPHYGHTSTTLQPFYTYAHIQYVYITYFTFTHLQTFTHILSLYYSHLHIHMYSHIPFHAYKQTHKHIDVRFTLFSKMLMIIFSIPLSLIFTTFFWLLILPVQVSFLFITYSDVFLQSGWL